MYYNHMSQGTIYLIINKENGHKYVGQTTQPINKRWQQHIQEANRMSSKPLHRAFRKYGIDKFTMKVIDECDEMQLNEKEQYWIEQYNTFESAEGYNATSGGDRPIFSQETKDKISNIMCDIERTDEWANNIKQSLTEKAKIEPWGCLTEENRGNGKHCGLKIMGINIETGEEKIWNSARDAAYELTGDRNKNSNILLSARKGYKAYGHRWKLLENKSKKKAVKGVHKRTWEEIEFESIKKATSTLGTSSNGTGLIKSLRNPHKYTWKGYYWFYN
jgi:group I intron endonuclease